LPAAVRLWIRAVEESPPGSPYLPGYLSKVGRSHYELYATHGHLELLNAAIQTWERAVALTPDGSSEIVDSLDHLAGALTERYLRTAALGDLETALAIHEQAVRQLPEDWPSASTVLNNYARALHHRFVRTGDLDDSAGCIQALRQALPLTRDPSVRRIVMTSLDTALKARFVVTQAPSELSEIHDVAYQLARLGRRRADPRASGNTADNLVADLLSGADLDSDNLVELAQELVESADDSAALRWADFRLAMVHLGRYLNDERPDDLSAAISAFERAMSQQVLDSPNLPRFLVAYATALHLRVLRHGEPDDFRAAIKAYAFAAVKAEETAPASGIHVAMTWGRWAASRGSWAEAVFAYGYGQRAARQLFRSQLVRTHKEVWLQQAIGLSAAAAYAQAEDHNPEAAVEALEDGRALLLSDALGADQARLAALGQGGGVALVERFKAASDRWDKPLQEGLTVARCRRGRISGRLPPRRDDQRGRGALLAAVVVWAANGHDPRMRWSAGPPPGSTWPAYPALRLKGLFDFRRAPSGFSLTIGGCAGCSATVPGAGSCPGSESRRRLVSPA
jgi:tetratricopeptide (TPR) repeat protein